MFGIGGDELTRLIGFDERSERLCGTRFLTGDVHAAKCSEVGASETSMISPGAAASAGEDAPPAASAVAPVSSRVASEGVYPRAESRGASPSHSGASVAESSAE